MYSTDAHDQRAKSIIDNYTWGAAGAMFAIPVPGLDMAATYAVWGKMIAEVAKVYHYEVALDDAKRLASDLLKGVVLTSLAWYGSAKLASSVLKFIPGAGTVTAYAIDAAIAAFGAKKITTGIGVAAAAYYKSGKTLAPATFVDHVKNVLNDPAMFLQALDTVTPGFPDPDKK